VGEVVTACGLGALGQIVAQLVKGSGARVIGVEMLEERWDGKRTIIASMRITILALGSLGDVLPFITLGQALQRVGHQVQLATFENYRATATRHGLAFHPVRGDAEALLQTVGGQALAEAGQNVIHLMLGLMRSFGSLAQSYAEDFSAPALWETEAIINQLPGDFYSGDLAEKLGVPMLTGRVIPLTATGAFPLPAFPDRFSFMPGYNRLTYYLGGQLVWFMFGKAINRWRRQVLDLPQRPFLYRDNTAVPTLYGYSPHVVNPPPDWPGQVYTTGYWFPEEAAWQPPDELLQFLAAGSPPVFIGFGSMPIRRREETVTTLIEALAQSGQRAVLHRGWAGLGPTAVPKSVHLIDYVPYGWLFPRLAAVIHHGGSGTTGYGLRSGIPSIIVPFLFDQFFWGQRVADLGVGPLPIPFRRLSASRLAEAIHTAVSDTTMRQAAASLGAKIQAENGLVAAVDLIDSLLSNL
jgi:sterol 3beta-glucosyltransferase